MDMDWMEIISAHVMWKQRLTAFLAGTSTEILDPETIQQDNRCALGQWIYGDGQSMTALPGFEEVREMHAQFHQYASDVIVLHQSGHTPDAEKLLTSDYSRLSERLKRQILNLSRQVQSARDGIPPF